MARADFFQSKLSPMWPSNIHPTAIVHESVVLEEGQKVWAWSQIREDALIGSGTSIGQGCYVGPGVILGANCRVQNGALIYEPSVLEDSVFVGPGAVFTNDRFPRATTVDGTPTASGDWDPVRVYVESGASIGARVVLVGPVRIGRWAMVAAGAVVTADVKPFALVAGVPAVQFGWVGRAGRRLVAREGNLLCPETGEIYVEVHGSLIPNASRVEP